MSVQPETAARPAATAAAARPAAKKHASGHKTSAGHPKETEVTRPEDVATAAVQPAPTVRPATAAVKAKKPTSRHKTSAGHPKTPEVTPVQPAAPADPNMSTSTSTACDLPMASHPSDAEVDLEGWVCLWENAGGIPSADISWLKEDTERGLFTPVHTYKDIRGQIKRRRVMKSDRMWFYPPEPPGFVGGGLPIPQLFFRSRVFVWRPVGVWRYSLKCPQGDNCVGSGKNVHLSKSGYHSKVRLICDVSGWYTVITEVLSCGPCTKAARIKEGVSVGRWLAWDNAILSQLSQAHQAIFPAILTTMRGVDWNVVRLLRDRTEGNTMEKVWRHCTGESRRGVPPSQGPVHHTPRDHSCTRRDRLCNEADITGSTCPKTAPHSAALAPCLPAGRGEQCAGLPEPDPLHFWHGDENGFHQESGEEAVWAVTWLSRVAYQHRQRVLPDCFFCADL
ncbi:uncharacterized protein LOC117493206 [Trematomus bernacchii]|uniref:uncharacterized protein LOC117493206 n=1 Tax=Trematomus bernacchii TaxID=40690 RepID=UPI00146E3056|nr:uncharacterized protein LOC117493206 [Trematomus bernacchii]XP_033999552.1 uncharacterized protein LOC117493206 [Trematomus bernacchii]